MKLIIAGSRTFNNYESLKKCVDEFIETEKAKKVRIISGHAKGADRLGEKYADEKNFDLDVFYPDWESYGKSAGMIRNKKMANHATHCILFWDGKSKGTQGMIRIATEKNLRLRVIVFMSEPEDKRSVATTAK